jgi:predicted  nucleic acid-binding Zn-ribbon protein
MKICIVCGNTVNDAIRECTNCGSYSFRSIQKDIYANPRLKKWNK